MIRLLYEVQTYCTRYLSVRPIADLDSKIEMPFEPDTTLNKANETADQNHKME